MAGRGGLTAITQEERTKLLGIETDEDKKEYLEEILEKVSPEHDVATDKAWDGIHRVLTRQDRNIENLVIPGPEHGPLGLVILGGKQLMADEEDYIMRLVEAEQVAGIVEALNGIEQKAFSALYDEHCRDVWPEYDDEGLEYCWDYFEMVRDFYRGQLGNGRAVVFAVGL